MSLESEIKNLTASLTRLAEGVEKLLTLSQPSTAAAPERKTNHNVDGAKIERKSEAAEPTPASEAQEASEASSGGTEVVAPTFDDAKKAFLAIAQKFGAVEGTAKSREVLQRYGIPNLKALPVEQYGEFIELCGVVVAGGEV